MGSEACPSFEIQESHEADGSLRVSLTGELDLAVADRLTTRLGSLKQAQAAVRLDLSRLTFIDSSGLRSLTVAMTDARRDGWQLEIDAEVPRQVRKLIELVAVSDVLWPSSRPPV